MMNAVYRADSKFCVMMLDVNEWSISVVLTAVHLQNFSYCLLVRCYSCCRFQRIFIIS